MNYFAPTLTYDESFLGGIIWCADLYFVRSCKMCVHIILISCKSQMLVGSMVFLPFKNAHVQWKWWFMVWLLTNLTNIARPKKTQPLNAWNYLWESFENFLKLYLWQPSQDDIEN